MKTSLIIIKAQNHKSRFKKLVIIIIKKIIKKMEIIIIIIMIKMMINNRVAIEVKYFQK